MTWGGTVEPSSRQGRSAVLRPIKRARARQPVRPIVVIVARTLAAGAIVGLVLVHNAAQDWMLRQLMQTQSTQRDFFLENLPLVFPFVAGLVLAFALNPAFPFLGRYQFKGSVFVSLFLLPLYLMLGPWIGLALNLGPGQLWLVGGLGAVRLAPLFALVAGAGLAAALVER
jgi:hypothetical protein